MALFEEIVARQKKLAVIGLGYVGLPIAVAFAKKVKVIGFDVSAAKIEAYKRGIDATGDVGDEVLRSSPANFPAEENELEDAAFFIVAVPTPVQSGNVPDLKYVQSASRTVGKRLRKGS